MLLLRSFSILALACRTTAAFRPRAAFGIKTNNISNTTTTRVSYRYLNEFAGDTNSQAEKDSDLKKELEAVKAENLRLLLENILDKKLDSLGTKIEKKIDALDTKFEEKIGTIDTKFEKKFDTIGTDIGTLKVGLVALACLTVVPQIPSFISFLK